MPLWTLRKPLVHLQVPGIPKKSRVPCVGLKQLTLAYLTERYNDTIHVYTDGSVTPRVSTAAFVIPQLDISRPYRLDHKSSSTAAELVAIREAVRFVSDQAPRKWTILSDAKSALQALHSCSRKGQHYVLASEIIQAFDITQRNGHSIIFQWVPGHCGLAGNVLADAAAKAAADNNAVLVKIPYSRSDVNSLLRSLMREFTTTYWSNPDHRHRRLRETDPHMTFRLPAKIKRRHASLLHRIRLGVAFTRCCAHLIGRADSQNCGRCQVDET